MALHMPCLQMRQISHTAQYVVLCRWLKETAAAHEELRRTNKGLASIRSNVKQLVSSDSSS